MFTILILPILLFPENILRPKGTNRFPVGRPDFHFVHNFSPPAAKYAIIFLYPCGSQNITYLKGGIYLCLWSHLVPRRSRFPRMDSVPFPFSASPWRKRSVFSAKPMTEASDSSTLHVPTQTVKTNLVTPSTISGIRFSSPQRRPLRRRMRFGRIWNRV